MSLFPPIAHGHYDDTGHWQRTKYCFVDCGSRCNCRPPSGLWYDPAHDKNKRQSGGYSEGQRVIYTKRGESEFFNTEWFGTYRYMTPAGKHAIQIDGRKRLSLVASQNLRAAPGEEVR